MESPARRYRRQSAGRSPGFSNATGSVPPLTLRIGANTVGNQRHWLFYR